MKCCLIIWQYIICRCYIVEIIAAVVKSILLRIPVGTGKNKHFKQEKGLAVWHINVLMKSLRNSYISVDFEVVPRAVGVSTVLCSNKQSLYVFILPHPFFQHVTSERSSLFSFPHLWYMTHLGFRNGVACYIISVSNHVLKIFN